MRKGIMTVTIEINYDEMFKEENLDAIRNFVGLQSATVDDLIRIHMNSLGDRITNIVHDMPLIKYNINGELGDIITEQKTASEDADESNTEWKTERVEEKKSDNNYDELVKKLEQSLEYVGIKLGVPEKIRVNMDMRKAIETSDNLENKATENNVVKKFMGFEVVDEGMEEPYLIDYKPYDGGDTKQYNASEAEKNNKQNYWHKHY